jgi:cell division transport system permease protein
MFRREFTDVASLADELESNPFPASVEVRLQPDAEIGDRAGSLVDQLVELPGVADVRYDREWLTRIGSGLSTARGTGGVIAFLMALAAAVTVASVVRLGLQARRDEIEIMELVGSPIGFIRGPFVAEGILLGGIGAVVAVIVLWLGFSVVDVWWGSQLEGLLDGQTVQFLPFRLWVSLALGGMLVGGAGGLAAARHAV